MGHLWACNSIYARGQNVRCLGNKSVQAWTCLGRFQLLVAHTVGVSGRAELPVYGHDLEGAGYFPRRVDRKAFQAGWEERPDVL